MVNSSLFWRVADFCRFPVPRSRSEIAAFLISSEEYSSRSDRVVVFIRPVLEEACRRGVLVEYGPGDLGWEKARRVVRDFYRRQARPLPRKLERLYQANFFCLAEAPGFSAFPVLGDVNFDLVVLFYPLLRGRLRAAFFWNLLNLFLAYRQAGGRLRIKIHGLPLAEAQRESLLRALEQYPRLESFFQELPFQPNVEKAEEFLQSLVET